jgi:hypothetical protein
MHTFQLSAEDYGVQNDGRYPADGSMVVPLMPGGNGNFKNSFSNLIGATFAWEDRSTYAAPASLTPGITSYSDSANTTYNVKGHGKTSPIGIVLTSGN